MNLKNQKGLCSMLLGELRVLLGNARYQITGAAAKDAIRTMVEQIEEKVLADETVELTIVTHKKNGIVYVLCDAVAVEGTKFVVVPLYGSCPKLYTSSTLKRMFRKTVETLEVTEEDTDDTVPAAVDTDDKDAAADQEDTAADNPENTEVPAVPAVDTVDTESNDSDDTQATEATDKTEQDDTAANQNDKAANNKFSREDYKFLEHKTNKLAAEIVKYFLKLGYSYQFVSDYVKIHKNEHSIAKVYYTKKGSVRVAINPVCEQAFKSCFPVNYHSTVKAWTLGMKVFIAENDDLRTIHKFLSMVDKLHSEKYERRC